MACPYLSRRDHTFYLVPASAIVRDHNVERMSRLETPTWDDVCPTEIVVLRGRDCHGQTVHTWCVRLCFAVDGITRAGDQWGDGFQLHSSFLTPLPASVRRDLICALEGEGSLRTSALLTRCRDAVSAGRLDARASGWQSVHEEPDALPEGHPELPWMRRQMRYALRVAEAVTYNSLAQGQVVDGFESAPPSPLRADANAESANAVRAVDATDVAEVVEASEAFEAVETAQRPTRPSKRARVLEEARALQDILEEMANKQTGQEWPYLKASNHLKALVHASV